MILSVGQSDGSQDKRNGPEEKDAAMTSKKKEEAKKSKNLAVMSILGPFFSFFSQAFL